MENKFRPTVTSNKQFIGGNNLTNVNLKKFQETITIDAGAKRMNEIIEKKNIKFQKTTEKFKSYIDSFKKHSKNIDMIYEKRKELNKILFRKLLPINTSIEEETNIQSPKVLASYYTLSNQITNSQEGLLKLSVSNNSISNITEIRKNTKKQMSSNCIHPSFQSYLISLKEKQKFTKKYDSLESPLMKEIERLYERVINDEGIDIDGVSIGNLNDFDVHRNIDQIDLKEMFSREGPLKAKSRYWTNKEYKWRECVVLRYEENSLFSVIWDDELNTFHSEISCEFEIFKKKQLNKNKNLVQDKMEGEEEEEEDDEENIKTENNDLTYETYKMFIEEIMVKLSKRFQMKKKHVSRINVCFEFDNFNDHLMRFKDAVKAKIIYDYQSVYFKNLSVLYKNEINLILRSHKLSQGIVLNIIHSLKKSRDIDEFIRKEVFSFSKLALCKADHLVTHNKIHKFFDFKPWEEENIRKLNFKQKFKFLLLYLICKHKNIKPIEAEDIYLTSRDNLNEEFNKTLETQSVNQSFNLNLNEYIKLFMAEYTILNFCINPMPSILIPGEEYFIGKHKHKKFKEEIAFILNNMKNYESNYDDMNIYKEHTINHFNLYKVILNNKRILLNNSLILFDKRIFKCIKKIKCIESIFLFEKLKLLKIHYCQDDSIINSMSHLFSEPILSINNIIEEIFLIMHSEVYFNERINFKDKIYIQFAEKYDKIYNLFYKQISSFSQISLNKSCLKIKELKNTIFQYLPFDTQFKEFILSLPELERVKNYITSNLEGEMKEFSYGFFSNLYRMVFFYKKNFGHENEHSQHKRRASLKILDYEKKVELLNYMMSLIDKFNYNQSLLEEILRKLSPMIKEKQNDYKIVNITLRKSNVKEDKKALTKINFLINDILFHFEEFYKNYKEKQLKIENTFLMPQIKKIDLKDVCKINKEINISEIDMVQKYFDTYFVEFSPSRSEIGQSFKTIIDRFIQELKQLEFNKPVFPLSFAKKLLLKKNFKPESISSHKRVKENLDKKALLRFKNSTKILKSLDYPKNSQECSLNENKIFQKEEKLTEKIYSEVHKSIIEILETSFVGVYSYSSFFIHYIPFYFYKEDLIEHFLEKNLENNDLQFFDFFIFCLKRLGQDVDLFNNCIECGMISFDIKSFKEEVKKNLEKTRDRVLRFFRTKIKQIIDDGERVYNELKVKMNIQADCVDNYIDLSDFLNSDELTLSIENLKETFIKCEGFLQILEGNFSPLEIKQIVLFLNSYTWSKEISFIKSQKENELNNERHVLINQLKQESDELYELIERLEIDVKRLELMKNFEKSDEYETFCEKLSYNYEVIDKRCQKLNFREKKFKIEESDLSKRSNYTEVIEIFKNSWTYVSKWRSNKIKWMNELVYSINKEEINEYIIKGQNLLKEINEFLVITPNNILDNITDYLETEICNFEIFRPLYYIMRLPIIREWHWIALINTVYFDLPINERPNYKTLTLMKFSEENPKSFTDFVNNEIHKKALEEHEIDKKLSEIDYQLKNIDIEFFFWEDFNILFLKNIIELISDLNAIIIMSDYLIKNKKNYINHFLDRIDELKSYVKSIESSLKLILSIQDLVPTLAKLFSVKEFMSQLISESRNFTKITVETSNIITKVQNLKSILILGEKENNQKLNTLRKEIEEIHHKSIELIENYRKRFPRFLFLSDENLLLFISNCKNFDLMRKYINQCFYGIKDFIKADKGKINDLKISSQPFQQINNIDEKVLSFEDTFSELISQTKENILQEGHEKTSVFYRPSSETMIIGIENNFGEKLFFLEDNNLLPMAPPMDNEQFYQWLFNFEKNIFNSLNIYLRNNFVKRLNEGIEIYFKEESFNCQFIEIIEKSLFIEYIRFICTIVSNEEKDKMSFTVSCERKFTSLLNSLEKQILKIQAFVINSKSKDIKTNLIKLETLILVLLYNRELIKFIIKKMIFNFGEFEIYSLLKPQVNFETMSNGKTESFKMNEYLSSNIFMKNFLESEELYYIYNTEEDYSNIISCSNVRFELMNLSINYGFELSHERYQHIIHPFKDRFIFNFTVSLTNNFFFITAGSRSSGKTNTVKEIANTLGKTVVELNALLSNNSYSTISNILKASARNGYYFFVDNINQISNPIISSLLQGLISIRNAIFNKSYSCLIDYDHININPNFSFISTFTLHENIISDKNLFSESIKNKSFIFENLPKNIFEHFRIFYIFSPNFDYILRLLFNSIFLCDKTDYLKKYSDIYQHSIKKLNFSQFTNSKAEEYCDKLLLLLRLLEKNIYQIDSKDNSKMKKIIKEGNEIKPQNIFLSLSKIKLIFRKIKELYIETKINETEKNKMINLNHLFAKAIYLSFESILTVRFEQVFASLLTSLFDVNLENIKNEIANSIFNLKLRVALSKQLKAMNLEVLEKQNKSIYKLVEMITFSNTRSILIVGDPMVGKSTTLELASKLLIDSINDQHISSNSDSQNYFINLYNINLNILSPEKLFGSYINCPASNLKEWKEGILLSLFKTITNQINNLGNDIDTHCVRKIFSGNSDLKKSNSLTKTQISNNSRKDSIVKSLSSVKELVFPLESWIVFDHSSENNILNDINPQFEKLTTLLEDRPCLNLENGEFSCLNVDKTRFFFESTKIDNISPSFLSKIQMIYLSKDTMTCNDIFRNYIDKKFINIYAQQKELLVNLYKILFLPFLKFCRKELKNEVIIHLSDKVLTGNLITFYDVFLYEYLKQLIVIEKINVSSIEQTSINQKFSLHSKSRASGKFAFSNEEATKNKSLQTNSLFKKGTFRSIKSFGSDNKEKSLTNEQLIEALMINFITKILGQNITKKGQKLALKYIVQLIDNYILIKKDKDLINLNNEKKNFAAELLLVRDFPDTLFDYYYEITEFKWIRFIDYPHYDSKLNNFKGKVNIEALKVTVSQKNFDNSNFEGELFRLNPKLKQLHTEQKLMFSEHLYIPTTNFLKCADLLNFSISYYLPILLVGPENTGKSYLIRNKLLIESEKNILRFIQYNCQQIQSVTEIQNLIQRYLERKYNGNYSSPGKQVTYIFLDDVNMSKSESNSSNSNPLEVIREWSNFGGWYDEKLPCFNEINGISFICNYSYRNSVNYQNKFVPSFSDRILKNFFIIFFSDLTKEDFLNIFKSQYSNECMGKNVKDNFANLIFIDQFVEVWYSNRSFINLNFSNNFNFNLSNLCNMMKSFKVFDINMNTTIEEILDIWITIFKSYFIKPLSTGPTNKSFSLVECFFEKHKDLLVQNKQKKTIKSNYKIHIIRENEVPESESSGSGKDGSSDESFKENDEGKNKTIANKLTKNLLKCNFDNCGDLFDHYKDDYFEKYNIILSNYKFLERSKKELMYNDNMVNKRRGNVGNVGSVEKSDNEDFEIKNDGISFKKRESILSRLNNLGNIASLGKTENEDLNNRNEESSLRKRESMVSKLNLGVCLPKDFSENNLKEVDEMVDEFLRENYFSFFPEVNKYNEKFNKNEVLDSYLFFNEKTMIITSYFLLKSLSFLKSPLYIIEYFLKNFNEMQFFNSFYLNKLNEDSETSNNSSSEIDLNESMNDYSSKYCRITNKNEFNYLVEYFIELMKRIKETNKINIPSIKLLEDNSKYYISTFMNNILDLNLLMDFDNNFLIIKHANYIDGTFISFLIQHLSLERKMEFNYMRLANFKTNLDGFYKEMLKMIDEILLHDKYFLYCMEFDNYNTEDKLAQKDYFKDIEKIINTICCLKLKLGTEIFSLKRVKEYTDKVRLPENVLARNKNFEFLLTTLYEKITQNLKIVFILKDNKLYDPSEFHFNSGEISCDMFIGKLLKTYFRGFSEYYFDFDVNNSFVVNDNDFFLLNDIQSNNYDLIRNIYYELLCVYNHEALNSQNVNTDDIFSKISFEEVFFKFNHQKEILLNFFKSSTKELQIYRNINYIERYRLKKERKLNKLLIILQALQSDKNSKEESLKILLESFNNSSKYVKCLEECKELKAIFSRFNYSLDLLITTTTTDIYEEFLAEYSKKVIPKAYVKIFQFIDNFLKQSSKLKNSISQEEKIVFLKEFSNFNSFKEYLKVFKIFNHIDKIEYLNEICSESSSKMVPFARNIMTLLTNGLELLKETVKKEEIIKQFLDSQNLTVIQIENEFLKCYDENLQNCMERINHLEREKNILTKIAQEINFEVDKKIQETEKIKKNLKFYNKFYTKNRYILQSNNFALTHKPNNLDELNKSAIFYAINQSFILMFPKEFQRYLLVKLCEMIYGDKNFFCNEIIPSFCEGYIFKIIGYSSVFHDSYFNVFLNLEILLDIYSQTIYLVDPLDLVSPFLISTRPKRIVIESHTIFNDIKDKIVQCMENGYLLVFKNMDKTMYEEIKPIVGFINKRYINQLDKNYDHQNESVKFCEKEVTVHTKFKMIIIDRVESKLFNIYLRENIHLINLSNSSTLSLNQDILFKISNCLNFYKIYESRLLSFSYCALKSIQSFLTDIFINVFEKYFPKDNYDLKEISTILEDKLFITELNAVNDMFKSKSQEALQKIRSNFPVNEQINIQSGHSYKLLKFDLKKLNINLEEFKELFTKTGRILNNMHDALKILRNNFKETYYYSDYWVFNSLIKSSIEYATKSKQVYFQPEEMKECIKYISTEFLSHIYYSLRGKDYNLFGFILCLVRMKENCSNEDEYNSIRDVLNILFNSKVKDGFNFKQILKELFNINYVIPEMLNNYTVNLMLEYISLQKRKNSDNNIKTDDKNLSNSLKCIYLYKLVNLSAKKSSEFKKNEEQRDSINISAEDLERLTNFPQDNASIIKALLYYLPDFMNQFSSVVSLQEPSVKNFLSNNYIEDVLNNIEFGFDETLMKLFTSVQRLVFVIAIKCELLNTGMRIYTNEFIKHNNSDSEKDKIHRFFKDKLNILKIIYDVHSKYPVNRIYEYASKFGKEIESYSVGYSDTFLKKARFNNHKVLLLENFHLVDDNNLKLILKKIYEFYLNHNEENEKKKAESDCLDIILLVENSQYNINRFKQIIKMTHFAHSIYVNPKTNIKSLISDEYKEMEIALLTNNSNLIRSNFFNKLNMLKERYNPLYKKYFTNNYICHSLLFIKAVLSLRNNINETKNKTFYIPRLIENNFDDFFLVQQIFFETICNLSTNILESNDPNIIKRLILNNIEKVLVKVVSVDNELNSQNKKMFLKDLIDFCLRRMEDHQIIVYNSFSYTFPGKKDYDLKEIREHILTYLPNFDHPSVLGINKNSILKKELESSVNNFKYLHSIVSNLFHHSYSNSLNVCNSNLISISSSSSNCLINNVSDTPCNSRIKHIYNAEKAIEIDLKHDLRVVNKKSTTNVVETESSNNKVVKIGLTMDKYTFLTEEIKGLISVFHEFDENFIREFKNLKINYYEIQKKIYKEEKFSLPNDVKINDLLESLQLQKMIYIVYSNSSRLVFLNNFKRILKTIVENTPNNIQMNLNLLNSENSNMRSRSAVRFDDMENELLLGNFKKKKYYSTNAILIDSDLKIKPLPIIKMNLKNINLKINENERLYSILNNESIYCCQNVEAISNLNRMSENIRRILTKIYASFNNEEVYNLSYYDMVMVNCIKNNLIPTHWLEKFNIDPTENLIDWFWKFIKKFNEFRIIETNANLLYDTLNYKSQNGNVFNSILNLMMKFSFEKKVPMTKISFIAVYKIGTEIIKENDEGFCMSSIVLKNCYYDSNTNQLIEEKYKSLQQSIPALYVIPEKSNKHIVIRIINDAVYKKLRMKGIDSEELRFKTKSPSKKNIIFNEKKNKSFAKISFLLKSKLTDLIDKTPISNENEPIKQEEVLINNTYSNIKVKQTMNTLNNEDQSVLSKVNQNITPFKYNTEENKVYDVMIPLVITFKKNNGSQYMIYLNFKSNEKQLYWDSVGAFAMLKN